MSAPPRVDDGGDFKLLTVEGGQAEPATVTQVFRALAFADAMRKRRTPIVHVPPRRENAARPRPRGHRSRPRQSSSRDGPDDPDLDPPPAAFIPGFTAASERLSRHLQRRAATRYVA
jgi:hypothetical protein